MDLSGQISSLYNGVSMIEFEDAVFPQIAVKQGVGFWNDVTFMLSFHKVYWSRECILMLMK